KQKLLLFYSLSIFLRKIAVHKKRNFQYTNTLPIIMRKTSLLILFIALNVVSCAEKTILERLFDVEKPDLAFGGMIKSSNPFQIEGDNGKRYIREKGGVGGINLKTPELEKLYGAEEIVTDSTKAILIIDFPLNKIVGYEIENKNGFNKRDLTIELSKAYSEIYAEKDKYGICCEKLSDLELKNILVFEVGEQIYLETKVESKK
ncbi:hypothetical protein, partial [Polaribacter sp. Z022]|uniref:hypothetical protein n=1 Tax=Polaribacter sp. Z022 TaxID=2927125 RepID=UPI002021D5F8